MWYRAFKRVPDGAWLSALITTSKKPTPDKSAFTATPKEHAEQVCAAYGLSPRDVQVVDAVTDPRVAPLVMPRLGPDASEPLAATLLQDVDSVAGQTGVRLPPPFRDALARRVRDRLRGAL